MRKLPQPLKISLAVTSLVAFSACNTIQGIGQDIQSAGKGIQNGAETVQDEITGDKKKEKSPSNGEAV